MSDEPPPAPPSADEAAPPPEPERAPAEPGSEPEPPAARPDTDLEPSPVGPAAVPGRRHGFPVGRGVLGLVLVGIGIVWLLEAVGAIDVSFLVALPIALIVIGLAMLFVPGRHGGLVVLGIVLTLVLTLSSGFDIKLQGGVGDHLERPTSLSEVRGDYHLSAGQFTLDFRSLHLEPGSRVSIAASLGLGEMVVRVPAGIAVRVHGTAGAGQVTAFGRTNDGLGADLTVSDPAGATGPTSDQAFIDLRLSVGLGQITVTR